MNRWMTCLALVLTYLPTTATRAGNGGDAIDTARIEEITGLHGTFTPEEGVFKVSKPRTDAAVMVDGRRIDPFQGLASWAAFKSTHMGTMVMGDLVLFQDEVNPAMSAAFENGLSVTALHNHFFYDSPKVFFMHIGGEGNQDTLATGVRRVLDKVGEIRAATPEPASAFGGVAVAAANAISPDPLREIFGVQGTASNGMFKAVFGRSVAMAHGTTATKELGVNTWAAFAGSDEQAMVDGDFAVLESELQPVLRSLRASGINIVAIHNHMTGEEPRMLFLHYWGTGRAASLARAVKDALALTGS